MTLSAASILSRSTGSGSSSARDLWCCCWPPPFKPALAALIANLAAVLEDRPGIKIVAKIEKIAVDHFDAVVGVVDVAEQIRLRQHETFRRDLAAEQAIDARDKIFPSLGRIVLRQRHQNAPAFLGRWHV